MLHQASSSGGSAEHAGHQNTNELLLPSPATALTDSKRHLGGDLQGRNSGKPSQSDQVVGQPPRRQRSIPRSQRSHLLKRVHG